VAQRYITRFGPQPIRDAVWRAGWTHAAFRDLTGIKPSGHVAMAMNGRCPPNAELRRVAPQLLGLPLDQLFTPETLARVHQPKHRPRARSKATA
jgi:hypothetical protein